jgi:hypothetical protein
MHPDNQGAESLSHEILRRRVGGVGELDSALACITASFYMPALLACITAPLYMPALLACITAPLYMPALLRRRVGGVGEPEREKVLRVHAPVQVRLVL